MASHGFTATTVAWQCASCQDPPHIIDNAANSLSLLLSLTSLSLFSLSLYQYGLSRLSSLPAVDKVLHASVNTQMKQYNQQWQSDNIQDAMDISGNPAQHPSWFLTLNVSTCSDFWSMVTIWAEVCTKS